jgi:RHS repeat-associated protein
LFGLPVQERRPRGRGQGIAAAASCCYAPHTPYVPSGASRPSSRITAPTSFTWGTAPDGSESVGTVLSLKRTILNDAGQTVATDQYFDLTSVSYSQTSATLGSAWSASSPTAGNYYHTAYAYNDRGRLKKTVSPAGTISRIVYDGLGRVTSTWVGTDDVPTSGYWSPTNTAGTDLVKVSENEYDGGGVGDGNRTYKENELSGGLSKVYTYDGLNQLAGFQRGTLNSTKDGISGTVARNQSWDPDALGNFESVTTNGTAQTRTHNKQNELTGVGSNTLTYDNNGNLTTDETGRTFTYDAWNRPIAVNGTIHYAYDALGRRVREGTTLLLYTPAWQVVEERDWREPTTYRARYVWSPVYVDALVLRDRLVASGGDSGSSQSATAPGGPLAAGYMERMYALQDANYDVTALVDTSGTVLERYVHDPYGLVAVYNAGWSATGGGLGYGWQYLHQGGRWDQTAGLYNFRSRDFSPTLMRWAEPDPIGFQARDFDLYRYERDTPPNRVDPTGEKCKIAFRCYVVKVGFRGVVTPVGSHCGLVIQDDIGTLTLDGGGGSDGQQQLITDAWPPYPPETNPRTGPFTDNDDKVCKCLRGYKDKFNNAKIPRDTFEGNSSWTLRCMVTKCRVSAAWPPPFSEPSGYNGRGACIKYADVPNPNDPCKKPTRSC